MTTPRDEGYRQPAEWAPHDACWLAWPTAEDLWQEDLPAARSAFAALARAIADPDPATGFPRGERLVVLVHDDAGARAAQAALGVLASYPRIPFGDIWMRDTGPIFVTGPHGVASVRFAFNGWGGKYVLQNDDGVAERVQEASGLPAFCFPFVLEGGAVEPDGEGTLLTTRQCLLNRNRNPGATARDVEGWLAAALGAERVLWLEEGLQNDHTDGHVDTLARFVRPGVVACMAPAGPSDPNRAVLEQIARDLERMGLDVVRVPGPGAVLDAHRRLMPASYMNYYVANTTVVVPTYGAPSDDAAVEAIGALYPGRRAVGIDARAILTGGGAFHCITQQQPRGA